MLLQKPHPQSLFSHFFPTQTLTSGYPGSCYIAEAVLKLIDGALPVSAELLSAVMTGVSRYIPSFFIHKGLGEPGASNPIPGDMRGQTAALRDLRFKPKLSGLCTSASAHWATPPVLPLSFKRTDQGLAPLPTLGTGCSRCGFQGSVN